MGFDDDLFAQFDSAFTPTTDKTENKTFEQARADWKEAVEKYYVALQNDPNVNLDEADTRFSTSLPLRIVQGKTVAIVGAGGLGNWQWRVLLGMGFNHVAIFDDDDVGIENIGPQGHSLLDIGVPKVEAVQRAGVEYRGTEIQAVRKKVFSYSDICSSLGYNPDIVIGCTDSTAFRNTFIERMLHDIEYGNESDVPQLFLDYRMSLGLWNCYAIPARIMANGRGYACDSMIKMRVNYANQAIFEDGEAVQEPCTARAIVYTGMHVAAYTGAFLHWWLNDGCKLLTPHGIDGEAMDSEHTEAFDKFYNGESQFPWMMSYDARDWEQITTSKAARRLADRLQSITERQAVLESMIERVATALGTELNATSDSELDWFDNAFSSLLEKYVKRRIATVGCQPDSGADSVEEAVDVDGGALDPDDLTELSFFRYPSMCAVGQEDTVFHVVSINEKDGKRFVTFMREGAQPITSDAEFLRGYIYK